MRTLNPNMQITHDLSLPLSGLEAAERRGLPEDSNEIPFLALDASLQFLQARFDMKIASYKI